MLKLNYAILRLLPYIITKKNFVPSIMVLITPNTNHKKCQVKTVIPAQPKNRTRQNLDARVCIRQLTYMAYFFNDFSCFLKDYDGYHFNNLVPSCFPVNVNISRRLLSLAISCHEHTKPTEDRQRFVMPSLSTKPSNMPLSQLVERVSQSQGRLTQANPLIRRKGPGLQKGGGEAELQEKRDCSLCEEGRGRGRGVQVEGGGRGGGENGKEGKRNK